MSKVIGTLVIVAIVFSIVVFIPGPKVHASPAPDGVNGAGFFKGLWHGVTFAFNLVRSIAYADAATYETYSVKGYSIGYGIGIAFMVLFTCLILIGSVLQNAFCPF